MSYAYKFRRGASAPVPVPVPVPEQQPLIPRTQLANNENGFIPTKFGEEIADAKKTFLPRKPVDGKTAVDINDTTMFPSLGGGSASTTTPKTKSALHNWAAIATPQEPRQGL